MAAVTLLGSVAFTTASGTKTVTATPAVGDLIVIVAAHSGNTSTALPTDNAGGTYVSVASALKNASADRLSVWVRTALISSAASTIFTHAPGTSTGGGFAVLKITGMSRVGANAILQSATQANQSAATPAPVLSAAALTANALIGAVFNATNAATLTPRTSWTERVDAGYNSPTSGLHVMSRNSGETASTITWGSASASAFSSVVLELDTSVPAAYTLTAEQGSYAVTGQAAGLLAGWSVAGAQGTYSLTGQDASFTYQSASSSGAPASLPHLGLLLEFELRLTAEQGSYSSTGQDAGLRATRTMSAEQGTYSITGQDAIPRTGNRLAADFGIYGVTGIAADLTLGAVAPGDGSPAPLPSLGLLGGLGEDAVSDSTPAYLPSMGLLNGLGYVPVGIVADTGYYTITGYTALRRLSAGHGIYAVSGQVASLRIEPPSVRNPAPLPSIGLLLGGVGVYSLTCDAGIYSLVGSDALVDSEVTATQGSYAVTGQDAGLLKTSILTADFGTYAVTGQDAGFAIGGTDRVMSAEFGTYSVTGQDATLLRKYPMPAEQGFYALHGQFADLYSGAVAAYVVQADSGTYQVSGRDVAFSTGLGVAADTGYYTLTGYGVRNEDDQGEDEDNQGGWPRWKPPKKKKRPVEQYEAPAEVVVIAPEPKPDPKPKVRRVPRVEPSVIPEAIDAIAARAEAKAKADKKRRKKKAEILLLL